MILLSQKRRTSSETMLLFHLMIPNISKDATGLVSKGCSKANNSGFDSSVSAEACLGCSFETLNAIVLSSPIFGNDPLVTLQFENLHLMDLCFVLLVTIFANLLHEMSKSCIVHSRTNSLQAIQFERHPKTPPFNEQNHQH